MRELKHPNVLGLYTAFVSESALWMIMPFISGGPLSGILQKKFPHGMDEPVLATVARDVLHGLDYLHKHDCMHRDVKVSFL
jgi:serine/threonine-protein kinase OSR1/STK39